jgi:hypothetical protein
VKVTSLHIGLLGLHKLGVEFCFVEGVSASLLSFRRPEGGIYDIANSSPLVHLLFFVNRAVMLVLHDTALGSF